MRHLSKAAWLACWAVVPAAVCLGATPPAHWKVLDQYCEFRSRIRRACVLEIDDPDHPAIPQVVSEIGIAVTDHGLAR